jgi:response regulator NasT
MDLPVRIAIADDEPDIRDYFRKILPRLGYQVVAAAQDGGELIEQCRSTHPELVITDVRMPKVDGITAAAVLSEQEPVPVILMSAASDDIRDRGTARGVLSFLLKPIRSAELAQAIRAALQQFRQVRAEPPRIVLAKSLAAGRMTVEG